MPKRRRCPLGTQEVRSHPLGEDFVHQLRLRGIAVMQLAALDHLGKSGSGAEIGHSPVTPQISQRHAGPRPRGVGRAGAESMSEIDDQSIRNWMGLKLPPLEA